MKDAYYFPHFSNARNDRKLRRVRKDLGLEGYGAFFMLLEILRDEKEFKYPLEDIDMLAEEIGISEVKLRGLIFSYDLFQTNDEDFFSLKFLEYLQPYIKTKARNRINGIKGNLIRYGYATKEELKDMTDLEVVEFNKINDSLLISGGESGGDRDFSQSKVKKSKEKESKEKESKVKLTKLEKIILDIKELKLSEQLEKKFIEFTEYRKKETAKELLSLRSINSAIKNVGKDFNDEIHLIESIEGSMNSGWMKIVPAKNYNNFNNNNKPVSTKPKYVDKEYDKLTEGM